MNKKKISMRNLKMKLKRSYGAAVNIEEEYVEMMETSRQYQNNVEVITTMRALDMRTINMGK